MEGQNKTIPNRNKKRAKEKSVKNDTKKRENANGRQVIAIKHAQRPSECIIALELTEEMIIHAHNAA